MTTMTPSKPHVQSASQPADTVKVWGLMAEFDSPEAIYEAAKKVREAGYRWWDCHVPFPVHGLDTAMGIKPTILPILVFFGGLTGLVIGIFLQWFANASDLSIWGGFGDVSGYPMTISGKPLSSIPAWIPVIFELTILLSALGCVGWMLLLNGLPHLYHPTLKSKRFLRVTDDRFFVVIESRDPLFVRSKTEGFLESLHPLSIESLEA